MTNRELDVLVAKNIMEWTQLKDGAHIGCDFAVRLPGDSIDTPVLHFSTDESVMHFVEGVVNKLGHYEEHWAPTERQFYVYCYVEAENRSYTAVGETKQIALCKAALKAVLKRDDLPDDINKVE